MKRFSMVDLILMVSVGAMTAYFVRAGIDLQRRGFTASEIAIVIGATIALNVAACWAVLAFRRRRGTARGARNEIPPDSNDR